MPQPQLQRPSPQRAASHRHAAGGAVACTSRGTAATRIASTVDVLYDGRRLQKLKFCVCVCVGVCVCVTWMCVSRKKKEQTL